MISLKGKSFLKLLDFTPCEINGLLDLAAELKRQKKADSNKAGIINAIKFIFSNKELRNLIIIKTIFDAAIIAVTNYEPIMTEAGMTPENKTIALYFYPVRRILLKVR